jgi:hypothetical protein
MFGLGHEFVAAKAQIGTYRASTYTRETIRCVDTMVIDQVDAYTQECVLGRLRVCRQGFGDDVR